jgi:hypothetical protein
VKREAFGAKALVDEPASLLTRNEQSRWPNIPQNPHGFAALQYIWAMWRENASESWIVEFGGCGSRPFGMRLSEAVAAVTARESGRFVHTG